MLGAIFDFSGLIGSSLNQDDLIEFNYGILDDLFDFNWESNTTNVSLSVLDNSIGHWYVIINFARLIIN